MAQVPQPTRIMELFRAPHPTFAMLAGMQLDLFTPLGSGPMRVEELADALDLDMGKLSILLYGLVVAGLLTVEEGRFSNTAEADHFLVRGRPAYMGDVHPVWSQLCTAGLMTAESVRTGIPQAQHDYGRMEEGEMLATIGSLHAEGLRMGEALAARYDFASCRSVLDVGGGTGGTSIALAETCPGVRATVADLPTATSIAERYLTEAGMNDRVGTLAIDLTHTAAPTLFDGAVLYRFIQVLGGAEAKAALMNVGRSVRPGGAIYVVGSILDDSRLTPVGPASMNVLLLSFYDGGQAYTEGEYRTWLTDAGFVDIVRDEPINGSGIIRARKAG